MAGYAELDAYGHWAIAPGYGEVWYPNVPAGWAPYTDGGWVSIEPWGWTWIDAEPWGFAPSHYGRWAFVDEKWCWAPGTYTPSPVYAPALVGFLGGPAIGPQAAWFALAPGEVYWPSYSADPNYIRRLNRTDVANIDGIYIPQDGVPPAQIADALYANRRFAAAVPFHVFASGSNGGRAALHPADSALEHAPVTMRPPQVRPATAEAHPGSSARVETQTPPASERPAKIVRPRQPPHRAAMHSGPLGHAAAPRLQIVHLPPTPHAGAASRAQ
jgi:hypothetical protein